MRSKLNRRLPGNYSVFYHELRHDIDIIFLTIQSLITERNLFLE
jgi:hypothetical protein